MELPCTMGKRGPPMRASFASSQPPKGSSTVGPRSPFEPVRAVPRKPHSSSSRRPHGRPLRANPCPEVTDLFCRLPLSTLSHRPESAKLGDLMRLLVRTGVRISHAIGFSRAVGSAPDGSKIKPLSQPLRPIAGQSDSRAQRVC